MKICHLMYDDMANPWLGGGGAVRAMELYRRLASRHEITVVSGLFPGAERETERHGLRLLRVGSARSYALSRLGYCRAAVAQLQRLEWDLWINEFSAFAPLRVPAALRRQGLLVFYHFMGLHALAKHPLVGGVAWLCERRALRAYERILTIAPSVQARVQRCARDAEVDIVYSGVDRRFFALAPEEGPYLLYFGRMDIHTKGIDLLIAAFAEIAAEHPDIRLKLAGRGTSKQLAKVRDLARRVGLEDRVEIIGSVDEERQGELLRRALMVCVPSRYEGWCMVAVEAAAAGKAVLGTDIDGLRDAVRHDETGVLVPPDDVGALADGMRALIADDSKRRALGAAGRAWAGRFGWDRLAEDLEDVYLRAVEEIKRGRQ
ncbi:MAG: glycosyltransferase family 4 protein [Gemmatimonadota bacterium]|nr:glycosyltransferase family 4 protein [Gemmatimonadota bacterium]